ncbi:MAG: hypothetical protein ABEH40_02145 [Haloferacaceae archaeon]
MPWIDASESDPARWRGGRGGEPAPPSDDAEPMSSTVARAHRAPRPFRCRTTVRVGGALRPDARNYDRAALHFDGAVTGAGRLKLVAYGYLWEGTDPDRRFRAQYRREAPPTETVPFREYTVWRRYQYGTVADPRGDVEFVPDGKVRTVAAKPIKWPALPGPVQLRLAELELVRNPHLARYVLRDLDLWEAVDGFFRWDPAAFRPRGDGAGE